MGEFATSKRILPPVWEAGDGEEIEMAPRYLKTPISSIIQSRTNRLIWVQIKFPYAVYDLLHRVYQNLSRFKENAVEHAVRMAEPSSGVMLPIDQEPEEWGWLEGRFLFDSFPSGEIEKQAILETRRTEFNRIAREMPNKFGVFTATQYGDGWQRYLELNAERGTDPYDQIEYLIRRGTGMVDSYEEHCARPVSSLYLQARSPSP